MLPLLTFASGVIAGAIGVRMMKSAKTKADPKIADLTSVDVKAAAREGAGKAQTAVREAAVTGLLAIERTSAGLRSRLATPVDAAAAPVEEAPVDAAPAEAEPAKDDVAEPAKSEAPPSAAPGAA
ncbi:hypothetical protein FBZ83_103291 [Azospirillum brasilense]|uniref:Uncharacterized protein n=1 Tax=Azospirillum brasilense TaxID=192 RepID=A0A560CLH8_AZOBR|nr:hypothetical protein [Azospirillum brasilense]TWA85699.1 hypothetical protein FBZ83_103291 [Azospirillum brasilense]